MRGSPGAPVTDVTDDDPLDAPGTIAVADDPLDAPGTPIIKDGDDFALAPLEFDVVVLDVAFGAAFEEAFTKASPS